MQATELGKDKVSKLGLGIIDLNKFGSEIDSNQFSIVSSLIFLTICKAIGSCVCW